MAVPDGLEILSQLDQLQCHQVGFTGFVGTNRYLITDRQEQPGDFWSSMFYPMGANRSFFLSVTDDTDQEVMRISRANYINGCCWCPNDIVMVESPPGQLVGRVSQTRTCCLPEFQIESATGEPQLSMQARSFQHCCFGDVTFPIVCPTGEQIGNITEFYSGPQREAANAHDFRIEFPADLDVSVKATLIGAMFLLDFRMTQAEREAEEQRQRDHNRQVGHHHTSPHRVQIHSDLNESQL